MPRTIIVGVDGSERDDDAIALGGLLAQTLDARVLAVTTFAYPVLSEPDDPIAQTVHDQAVTVAGRAVQRLQRGRAEACALASWSPASGLERVAREQRADLVVVGSSRRGGFGRIMAGSTPERLLHAAPCALAIAPLGYGDAAQHALASIGVGFDGSAASRAALDAAAELACSVHAKLSVLCVLDVFVGPPVQVPTAAVDYATDVSLLRKRAQHIARDALTTWDGLDAEIVTPAGDAGITLAELSPQLDLLFIGSHAYGPLRRLLHGSVSTRLVRAADCPIVVMPPGTRTLSTGRTTTAAAAQE